MIVIGSYAAHLNGLTTRKRFKDLDLIGSEAEREQFRQENADLIVKEKWVHDHRFRMDLRPGSEFDFVEFDIEDSPATRLLQRLCPKISDVLRSRMQVPPLEVLYLNKRSHAHLPIGFTKTLADLKVLKAGVGAVSRDQLDFLSLKTLEQDQRYADHRSRFGLALLSEDINIPASRPPRYHREDLFRLVSEAPIHPRVRDLMRPGLMDPVRFAGLTHEDALRLCREDFMIVGLERYAASDPEATSATAYERGMIKAMRDLFQPDLQAFAIDHAQDLSAPPQIDFVGRFRAALAAGQLRSVTLRPTAVSPVHRQIMALIQAGDLNKARCLAEDLARSADLTEDHHALYLLALVFLKRRQTQLAEACLKRSLWRIGDNGAARLELGLICLNSGRAKAAAHHLQRARELGPANLRTLEALARALEADSRPTEAFAAYEEALTLAPDNVALKARRDALVAQAN